MKSYTKVYFKFFGYTIADWIQCEIPDCGQQAVDICHIWGKKNRPDLVNDINNLMAKCRLHHTLFGDKSRYRKYLQDIHDKIVMNRLNQLDNG